MKRVAYSRRDLLRGVAAGATAALSPALAFGRCSVPGTLRPVSVSARAADLVLESPVVDLLGLLTLDWQQLFDWQSANPGGRSFGPCDDERARSSGVRLLVPAVEAGGGADAARQVSAWLDGWRHLVRRDSCFLRPVESILDLTFESDGRLAILVGFQNSTHFGSVADVGAYFARGQRLSQITYNRANALGSGCHEGRDGGLTAFGAEIVAEMNRVGMMVDVSHCGPRTTLDAVAASRGPVLATHTNCRALNPGQPRCKSDEELRAIARRGGVVGITVVRAFVSPKRRPTIDDLLDHFDHAIRLVGPGHVAIGSDTDYASMYRHAYALLGLDPVARVFQIADGLLQRGYSAEDVRLVLSDSALRTLAALLPSSGDVSMRDPFCALPKRREPEGVQRFD